MPLRWVSGRLGSGSADTDGGDPADRRVWTAPEEGQGWVVATTVASTKKGDFFRSRSSAPGPGVRQKHGALSGMNGARNDALVLTVKQAAELLQCSPDQVYELIRRTDL